METSDCNVFLIRFRESAYRMKSMTGKTSSARLSKTHTIHVLILSLFKCEDVNRFEEVEQGVEKENKTLLTPKHRKKKEEKKGNRWTEKNKKTDRHSCFVWRWFSLSGFAPKSYTINPFNGWLIATGLPSEPLPSQLNSVVHITEWINNPLKYGNKL